ncbi:tetratricopeptide (TPR) repeat protein [Oikeobacillus pervagus]|uniref:Tetratricopeptide (TPR) repeat protein n=1 Tax=Oikeobacillus pervagus TaxID=1325931 RepID=A0AAJ1T6B5_9BACI|nr:tetratricopeptide repeat protein [Oikeobacillus pervagus]MDQ0215420.1 tetratricopeptide (TPR) repeat protein [Oikeobacillus pervagus]
MRKRKRHLIKQGNVIVFPGTNEKLIDKGIDALQKKQYREAANFLTEALQLSKDSENGEIQMALSLALYESSQFEQAKKNCKNMLHAGIGDYYDVLDLYMLILIQLKEYDEVVATLSPIIEEEQIPAEKRDHFMKLYQLGEKMVDYEDGSYSLPYKGKLFDEQEDLHQQTMKIAELLHSNIIPYIEELCSILQDEKAHPFLQSLILNVLKEHRYDQKVCVRKFTFSDEFIPKQLQDPFETPYYQEVIHKLEEKIAHDNPIFFRQIKEIVDRHFFQLYPFSPPFFPETWMNVTIFLANQYYGEDRDDGQLEEFDDPEWGSCLELMKKLDEISTPIH